MMSDALSTHNATEGGAHTMMMNQQQQPRKNSTISQYRRRRSSSLGSIDDNHSCPRRRSSNDQDKDPRPSSSSSSSHRSTTTNGTHREAQQHKPKSLKFPDLERRLWTKNVDILAQYNKKHPQRSQRRRTTVSTAVSSIIDIHAITTTPTATTITTTGTTTSSSPKAYTGKPSTTTPCRCSRLPTIAEEIRLVQNLHKQEQQRSSSLLRSSRSSTSTMTVQPPPPSPPRRVLPLTAASITAAKDDDRGWMMNPDNQRVLLDEIAQMNVKVRGLINRYDKLLDENTQLRDENHALMDLCNVQEDQVRRLIDMYTAQVDEHRVLMNNQNAIIQSRIDIIDNGKQMAESVWSSNMMLRHQCQELSLHIKSIEAADNDDDDPKDPAGDAGAAIVDGDIEQQPTIETMSPDSFFSNVSLLRSIVEDDEDTFQARIRTYIDTLEEQNDVLQKKRDEYLLSWLRHPSTPLYLYPIILNHLTPNNYFRAILDLGTSCMEVY